MKNALAADRYARALSLVITDDSDLDAAADALKALGKLVKDNHDFHNAVSNPAIDGALRERVLDAALQRLDITGPVKELMHELSRRGRIGMTADVAVLFRKIADGRLGRVRVVVTTAHALSAENEARLQEIIQGYTGQDVCLESVVDEGVIGGVRARLENTIIDGTLRARLDRIRDSLIAEEIS